MGICGSSNSHETYNSATKENNKSEQHPVTKINQIEPVDTKKKTSINEEHNVNTFVHVSGFSE